MRIAVVIPTFNRATLLPEAVDSVLAQTPPPARLVVVDDGSTDDTSAVFKARYGQDERVEYLYQGNAHVSAARNRGWQHVLEADPATEAILFLDSDDRLLPDALTRLTAALTAHSTAVLAYGRPRYVDARGNPSELRWDFEDFEGDADTIWKPLLHRNFICSASAALVRTGPLRDCGGWDTAFVFAEDWDLWLRLALAGGAFTRAAGEAPTFAYRRHDGSLTTMARARREANEEAIYRKHLALVAGEPNRHAAIEEILALRAAAAAGRLSPDEELIAPRHRLLRRLLEGSGLSSLYRRVPLRIRLRLREMVGVDRWA